MCICGHTESVHVTGRKDGVRACMECIEESVSNKDMSECEGFSERS